MPEPKPSKRRRPSLERLEKLILLSAVPGGTPDYFGGTPNWAYSPQPVVTTDTITGATTIQGGIAKFVDALPGVGSSHANQIGQYISVAIPDTTSFPGCDYYEIAAVQFTERLSSSLNPTTLRGYVQIETPSNVAASRHVALMYPDGSPILNTSGQQVYAVDPPMFLGAEIVAQSNRPVRVKFDNYLPTGVAGDLFLPVDSTTQGAGSGPGTSTTPSTVQVISADRVGSSGTAIEVATASPNGFNVGDLINFSGMEPVDYVGNFRVTSVIDSTHFQVSINEYPDTPAFTLGMVGEAYTQNRVGIHLHGGVTPWISDGTANQWITPANETVTYPTGVSTVNVPDMVDPGPGSETFYYTNQQSARLMFYHDHSLGITRLNVYAGLESGYLLTDAVEQNLINAGILPDNGTVLVLQDKTFIDPKTVLTTDPTWPIALQMGNSDLWTPHVWMTNQNPNSLNGANDYGRWDYGPWFWPPWVTTYNQIQGAGGLTITDPGRGYTMPPTITITAAPGDSGVGARATATIDPSTGEVTEITLDYPGTGYQLPPTITITPAKGDSGTGATATSSTWYYPNIPNISQTMEAYQDTAMVNGTAYPYVNVDPKTYRYQLLNGSDDRMLNLQMYTSSSILNTVTITHPGSGYISPPLVTITAAPGDSTGLGATAMANIDTSTGAVTDISIVTVGSGYTLPPIITFSASPTGDTAIATATIYSGQTEVGMVPAVQGFMQFPAAWTVQTLGQVGDILDSRLGGVPDPRTLGPAFIQIGNEGGFLPIPVVINSTPIGFERNPKNIVIGNVSQHGLLIGPAERADVLIDFSKYAGKTVILYNDAPAGFPAADSRVDYFSNDSNQTSTGGTVSTLPGYGPNTRTFMVFHVGGGTSQPYNLPALMSAFTTTGTSTGVFKADQMPPIVPSSQYNTAYGTSFPVGPKGVYSKIADTQMTFYPVDLTQANSLSTTPVTINMQPKAIQETFESSYGRMMANLGVEIPNTNGTNQTTISYTIQDPATEIIDGVPMTRVTANDGTQLWKITHNGVDTHTIHFHLFNVQVVNRVAWDGQVRAPDANELGWKETVRMNPLEDCIVAIKAVAPQLPFGLPDSIHALDPTQPIGASMGFANITPNGTPVTVTNQIVNFGWEYMWHCHVLSHEEMMMMRPIDVLVPQVLPVAPTLSSPLPPTSTGVVQLSWQDGTPAQSPATMGNLANEIGFRIERAPYQVSTGGIGAYSVIGTTLANSTSYTDTTGLPGQLYYYRVVAYNAKGDASSNVVGTAVNATVTQVSTPNPTGFYNTGKAITVQVMFNNSESVTGLPQLKLSNGAVANYSGGSGTNVLSFTWIVTSGFDLSQLDIRDINALELNGGSIAGTNTHLPAILTLPALQSAADLLFGKKIGIDTVAPILQPLSNLTSPLTDLTGAVVSFAANASDALSGIASISFSPPSGSHFAVGTTTVTCSAADNAGNTTTSTFTVTVANAGIIGSELVVVGTSASDIIRIDTKNPAATTVTVNGISAVGSPFGLPASDTLHVYGIAGDDTISIQGAVPGILDGGLGATTFELTGWNTSAGSVIGSGFAKLSDIGDSNFTLTDQALITVNQSIKLSGIAVANLTGGISANSLTLTGWTGSANLTGGGGVDTIIDSRDSNFNLTDTALTVGSQVISLSGIGIANLSGGISANTFTLTGWTGAAALIGGGGSDTLVDSRDSNFNLTDTALTVGSQVISLSGIGIANLSGGISANTFTLTGWTGAAALIGGGGSDTLVDSSNSNFKLGDTLLAINTQKITLSGIGIANLTGGAGNNSFDVSGWTGRGSLSGNGGADTLVATKDTSFTLDNTTLSTTDGMTLALLNIGRANLTGGTESDSFTVSNWTGQGSLTGGGGNDSVIATKNANLTLSNSVLSGSDGLNLTLTGISSDTLTVSTTNTARTINATGFSGASNLAGTGSALVTLQGGPGNDVFNLSNATGRATLSGGGGIDTLSATKNSSFTLTNSSLSSTDGLSASLTAIASANLTGGANNNTFNVSGWTGGGILSGGGGADTLTVTKNVNFVLTNTSLRTSDGSNLQLAAIGRANLTGGTNSNNFDLSGWSGAGTITGGGGVDSLTAIKDANFNLGNTSLTSTDGLNLVLAEIGTANLAGGPGNNSFTISTWTGAGSLTGGGGSDAVIATKNADITLTNASLTMSDGTNLALTGISLDTLTLNNPQANSRVIDASVFSGVSTLVATGAGQAKLIAGPGNDTLAVTGSGAAVMVGNAGDDTMTARGNGRVIEIGGMGTDTLSSTAGSSGTGQTIQIGGSTIYDLNLVALDALLSAWSSGNTFTQRTTALTSGSGVTGGYKFDGTTIIDDLAVNSLTNSAPSNAGQNWFLVRARDKVTKRVNDLRTNL